jgi:pyocin large subunit-like protein
MFKLNAFGAACAASAFALLALPGCGREADRASRVLAEDVAPTSQTARTERVSRTYDTGDRAERSDASRRSASGLNWASSRRGSAEDNARRQFERNGADFSAASLDAYVARARAFAAEPPRGVLKARRSNGDQMLYDPRSNTFLVTDREGAPRTMFKPREGRAYWDEQQQRLADGAASSRPRGARRDPDAADGQG